MSLHEELKSAFREFEISEAGKKCKEEGWFPEAADLADVAVEVLKKDQDSERRTR